jgi:hypothetical protein
VKTKKVHFVKFEVQKKLSLGSGRAENRSGKSRTEKPRFLRENGPSGGSGIRRISKTPRNTIMYQLEKVADFRKTPGNRDFSFRISHASARQAGNAMKFSHSRIIVGANFNKIAG